MPAPVSGRRSDNQGMRSRLAAAVALVGGLLSPLAAQTAQAAEPAVQRLRVIGGLAGMHQYTRHEEPFWTRDLPRLTGGRLVADIAPFDRAGIDPQEMLRLSELGTIAFGTTLLNASAADPELMALDLAGLNPDLATLRRGIEAFRPTLTKLMRERYRVELLALYVYPAQVAYCRQPFASLSDLAGRRVRVSGLSQWDFVDALGAKPVQTPFAQIVPSMVAGSLDCAITGTMSGNTLGLHDVTTHVGSMPINWGVAAFVASGTVWNGLDGELQAILRREIGRLERTIWQEAEAETGEGLACNTGGASCRSGKRGRMTEVRDTAADARLRREILVGRVIPAWIKRCGDSCAVLWKQTLGPVHGITLR